MENRILAKYIDLDKVAYKEVNFKSKLIEWSQKNRVKVDFKLLDQEKDKNGSPKFTYQVIIEGLEAGVGSGYSKKESQQTASKLTLEQLRKKPQFIDAIFAAKANRTKMEEMPVQTVPETEQSDDFIISHSKNEPAQSISNIDYKTDSQLEEPAENNNEGGDEFDLSDISTKPVSKEDIISAAEDAAFQGEN
jgi:ribonuclease-3